MLRNYFHEMSGVKNLSLITGIFYWINMYSKCRYVQLLWIFMCMYIPILYWCHKFTLTYLHLDLNVYTCTIWMLKFFWRCVTNIYHSSCLLYCWCHNFISYFISVCRYYHACYVSYYICLHRYILVYVCWLHSSPHQVVNSYICDTI